MTPAPMPRPITPNRASGCCTARTKNHAEDGMARVSGKRLPHDSSKVFPNINSKGTKKPTYCKQHAKDDIVDVNRSPCCH